MRSSSLTGKLGVEFADLRLHSLIVACTDRIHPILYHQLLAECATSNFKPTIAEEVTSPQQAFDLAQDGVGLAVLPFGVCLEAPADLKYFPISGLDPLRLMFIYRGEDSHRAEILAELAEMLRDKNVDHGLCENSGISPIVKGMGLTLLTRQEGGRTVHYLEGEQNRKKMAGVR